MEPLVPETLQPQTTAAIRTGVDSGTRKLMISLGIAIPSIIITPLIIYLGFIFAIFIGPNGNSTVLYLLLVMLFIDYLFINGFILVKKIQDSNYGKVAYIILSSFLTIIFGFISTSVIVSKIIGDCSRGC